MSLIKLFLHPIVDRAGKTIVHCTLFDDPFPTTDKLSGWISDAWNAAFDGSGRKYEECDPICNREVSRALSTSRTPLQTLTAGFSYGVAIGASDPSSFTLFENTSSASLTSTTWTHRRSGIKLVGCLSKTDLPVLIERCGHPKAR